MKVNGVVITSSPFPIFIDLKAKWRASVPELQEIAYFTPIYFATFFSRELTLSPPIKFVFEKTSLSSC